MRHCALPQVIEVFTQHNLKHYRNMAHWLGLTYVRQVAWA